MDKTQLSGLMAQVFAQANAQFGDVVKGHWLHDTEVCPGCGSPTRIYSGKGKRSVSLNTYIYRKRGMLIGYILCHRCSKRIHSAAKRNPGVQIDVHDNIERNLDAAFEAHLGTLN